MLVFVMFCDCRENLMMLIVLCRGVMMPAVVGSIREWGFLGGIKLAGSYVRLGIQGCSGVAYRI